MIDPTQIEDVEGIPEIKRWVILWAIIVACSAGAFALGRFIGMLLP